jgi:WD40 repeat protein
VSGTARSVLFIDDGMLAWGDEKGTIHLTDLKKGKEVRRLGGEAYGISELCRCPDGKTLASVREGPDHVVHLWQLDTGKRLSPALDVHQGGVESVAFSPDGKTLFSASSDRTVRSWDPATGKERQRLEGAFFRVAASPDGRILAATADGGRSLRFLDAASGKELRQIKYSEGSGWFTSVAFSPD